VGLLPQRWTGAVLRGNAGKNEGQSQMDVRGEVGISISKAGEFSGGKLSPEPPVVNDQASGAHLDRLGDGGQSMVGLRHQHFKGR
jgi:hypothetical protein